MITALWASPIVRRTCSPVALRSSRTVGSSSSIRASAGPILSRSPLLCGSMATISVGSGKLSAGSDQRLLADAQRVAGGGHGQLGDRADLAGLELADRLLLLAVEQQQLADPLVLALAAVPDVGLRMERARQHPQVGQPPDERVGGRLEHAHEQRPVLVGLDLDRRAALVLRLRRRLVGRGGEVADDRVEERAAARSRSSALPTRTGARTDSLTPLRRHASSSGSAISSPSRYLVSTSSSASAAASSSWSRRRATSSASSSGIGISSSAVPFQRHALRWTRST